MDNLIGRQILPFHPLSSPFASRQSYRRLLHHARAILSMHLQWALRQITLINDFRVNTIRLIYSITKQADKTILVHSSALFVFTKIINERPNGFLVTVFNKAHRDNQRIIGVIATG